MGVRDLFPKHFFQTARKAISIFEQLDADWMFIGAVSVAAWGRVRATTDTDFAISLDFTAAGDLDKAMKKAKLEKESGPVEIPAKRLVLSKYWAPYPGGGLGVDVFFATGYDTGRFLKKALQRKSVPSKSRKISQGRVLSRIENAWRLTGIATWDRP